MEQPTNNELQKVGTVLAKDQVVRLRELRESRQLQTRSNVSLADVIRDVVEAGLGLLYAAPITDSTASATDVAA
jgi:hypothetical protein